MEEKIKYKIKNLSEDIKELIHNVYTHLIHNLEIDNKTIVHFQTDRGFNSDSLYWFLQSGMYKSSTTLKTVATNFAKDVYFNNIHFLKKEDIKKLLFVPGFKKDERSTLGISFIETSKNAGFVIPLFDETGRIHSLKIRKIEMSPGDDSKYIYISHDKEDIEHYFPVPTWSFTKNDISFETYKNDTIQIVEGEIKASVCNHFHSDLFTVSIGGVGIYKQIINTISKNKNIKKVIVCFDRDAWFDKDIHTKTEDVNTAFITHLVGISNCLIDHNLMPIFARWNEPHKGIDDLYIYRHINQPTEPVNKSIKYFSRDILEVEKENISKLFGIPAHYKWIADEEVFLNLETGREYKPSGFRTIAGLTKKVSLSKLKTMMGERFFPSYESRIYDPTTQSKYVFSKKTNGVSLNTYTPPEITPINGDVSIWLDHFEYMFPDKKDKDIVHWWIAHNIQKPGSKIKWALAIQGNHRTGKSCIAYVLGVILGEENVTRPESDELHSQYNSWINRCVLSVFEEFDGKDKISFFNSLKSAITQDVITVVEKFKKPKKIQNFTNILLLTNNKSAFLLEKGDGRFTIIFSPAEMNTSKYYKKLWDFCFSKEGVANICYFYKNYDLSQFSPNIAPMTSSKQEILDSSKTDIEIILQDEIEDSSSIFGMYDILSVKDIFDYIKNNYKHIRLSYRSLIFSLRNCGCVPLGRLYVGNFYTKDNIHVPLKRATFFAVKNQDKWSKSPPEEITNHINNIYGVLLKNKNFAKDIYNLPLQF